MRSLVAALLGSTALLAPAAWAETQSLIYNDFSDVSGLTLNGSASRVDNKLSLTRAEFFQSGSAFSTDTITLNATAAFSTSFSFEILERGGLGDGADGLVFAIQTAANNVGGAGGGLGFSGIPRSLGIEFDTFDNGELGGSNHVGIDLNGSVDSVASTALLTPDFDNGQVWRAWVDYTNGLLEVRWSPNGVRPAEAGLDYAVDLPSVFQSQEVYVGFTSGTGSGYGNHNILNWTFTNDFVPAVPEPGSIGMMLSGLAALGVVGRLRRRRA